MSLKLSSREIREIFLSFFQEKDHRRIEGASLIPKNDPTLLFINSGMAPLKRYFTGQDSPPHPDLCNVQPCLRTRDIEDVGDRHHLTFFEMLGSWSIGGYFKEKAIELAYELLVERFGLDPGRLYASVFAGDAALNLPPDSEAASFWRKVGFPEERIVYLGLADNFWGPAGDTGPCGPCTEVFYDFGPAFGEAHVPGAEFHTTGRYIEIWNAGVFMQFDKRRDGTFGALPFFSVDTGAGLERLTMALNELDSVYDGDRLAPLVRRAQELVGGEQVGADHRRLADHMRAATFILADGVRPSNEGRGYIPRRLIRKCVAICHRAGGPAAELRELAEVAIEVLGDGYPHLVERKDAVLAALAQEEREFSQTLARGLDHLEGLFAAGGGVSGKDAFHLFATYGLPFEITRDLAAERGVAVAEEAYQEEFRQHQKISRRVATGAEKRLSPTDPLPDLPLVGAGHFVGYERITAEAHVLALFVDGNATEAISTGQRAEVLLDITPFYAESGGQVGDQGKLVLADGSVFTVLDTLKHGSGYHVSFGEMSEGTLERGQAVKAEVDAPRRFDTAANHSATHLLNAALRAVLGPHIRQAGSHVDANRLRFDFTHPGALKAEQIAEIERHVNRNVFANYPRTTRVLDPAAARATGAISLEGEDYGSSIRVVTLGEVGSEFCGGTHVNSTGEIGLLRVVGEQSVSSGVRRITAVTRMPALELMLERDRLLVEAAGRLKVGPAALVERIEHLVAEAKVADKPKKGGGGALRLEVDDSSGLPIAGGLVGEDVDVRAASIQEAERLGAVVGLVGAAEGKIRAAVAVPKKLADRVDARKVLADLLSAVGGRGGGNAQLAQGGGAGTADPAHLVRELPHAVGRALSGG